jgi:hypothetical protein
MTVIAITVLELKPGRWEDAQGVIKTGNALIKKHGGENVTTMVGMLAGPASGSVSTLWTTTDWESFGKAFNALMADPELTALMTDSMGPDGPTVGFDTYVNQTIPDL